jgi:hypothetical protein
MSKRWIASDEVTRLYMTTYQAKRASDADVSSSLLMMGSAVAVTWQ